MNVNYYSATTDMWSSVNINIVAAEKKLNWSWLNCFGHNLHLAVTNTRITQPRNGPVSHLGKYILSELVEEKRSVELNREKEDGESENRSEAMRE